MSESVLSDPDDELRKQLVNAGLLPQQMQQLLQRQALGQEWMHTQMAQGRQVGNTYVAASPLEHLSNAIRQIVGAKIAGDAMGGERDLVQNVGKARQQMMGALDLAHSGYQSPGDGDVPPNPQREQKLLMMAAGSGDTAMHQLSDFALKKLNYERQLAMMQNLTNYRERSLDIRDKGVEQRERDQAFVPDTWGVPQPVLKHAPKGGAPAPASALPGALGAGSEAAAGGGGGIPNAVLSAGLGVGNGTTPGMAANALPNSIAPNMDPLAKFAAGDEAPPPQGMQLQPTVLDGRLPQDRTSPPNQMMQMPTMALDGRQPENRTTPLAPWKGAETDAPEPEKPPMVPDFPDSVVHDLTRQWATAGEIPNAVHQFPMQARGKLLKAMGEIKSKDYPDVDFAPSRNKYVSGVAARKNLENNLRSISAFEETAQRNAEVAEQAIKKMEVNTGIPLANRPLRWIFENFGFDPGIAGARVGLVVALTEYSKITSGGTLGQRMTDAQRSELKEGASTGEITLGQWRSIRSIVDQDAANRKLGIRNQLKEIDRGFADVHGGRPGPAAPEAADAGSPDAGPSVDELLKLYLKK